MPSAVIYARYSSEHQREASIEDQVAACASRVSDLGWALTDTYSDYAISGASAQRPGYQALLADARRKRFNVVVDESLDRLSRDQADVATLFKTLGFHGVRLVTLGEGEINELHIGLKGTMNALYLRDLADKTRRGLRGRVKQGRSGGGLCYGYRPVAGDPGAREIEPTEAETVRDIFRRYAAGTSPKAIARALNAEGVAGPRGHAWGPSTINGNRARGTGVLNNDLYRGRLVWNRLTYVKDPETGKRVSRSNPESAWAVTEVPELRIADDDLWEAVKRRQELLDAHAKPKTGERGFWDRRRPRHLLSGLMACGACGGGYVKISQNLFGCASARNKGTCDNRLNIRRDVLETTILDGLKARLMDPDLVRTFADAFVAETNRLRREQTRTKDRLQTELERTERRIHSLVEAIADGAAPKALVTQLHELETEQDRLTTEIAWQGDDPPPILHPNTGELYRRKVGELERLLSDERTRDEAFAAIRGLIERVTLTPVDGKLQVDLQGQLANMLQLIADSKKPAADRDGLEQIKLVAGVGFEPTTFRL